MTDLKDTVFLPQTDFPLRAGLAQKEPEIMAFWQRIGLAERLQAQHQGKTPFVLHDGPPYANGDIHLGHALNKILKDVVNRTRRMQGFHVTFTPGWDCHGLPIEWKIEEGYRAKGLDKDAVPKLQFREECRQFAAGWVDKQREQFKRLGVEADWDRPYLTMTHRAESVIAAEILKFLENGSLYRGDRAVMWSVIEKTALAEAEVEYKDHKSTTVWVRFPVRSSPLPALQGARVVIWTTTPWTLPANQALAYGPEITYAVYQVTDTGEKLVLATALAESVKAAAKIADWTVLDTFSGEALAGTICDHPLHDQGYDDPRPLWSADFVTEDAGTGFVHIAPTHGEDDFNLGRAHGVQLVHRVGADGVYYDNVPLFAGKRILTPDGKDGDANGAVIKAIAAAGGLLAKGSVVHSYPHSWRSKAPIIFRCTPQWFVSMETNDLREKALKAIDATQWFPPQGRNRIHSMVEGRPDWCISRQRAWGVPIPLFVRKSDGQPLCDREVNRRIVEAFAAEGSDAWYQRPAQEFLGSAYRDDDFEQVFDVVDVWFDSGSTHAFTLPEGTQADLYLEGSDQHRGWFQSSLLESVGTRGRAPYKAVLTHGFLLDEKGYKMSKSLGNSVEPQDVIKDYGADVLRLMMINCDYSNDVNIGPSIIKQQAEQYRRLRNTLRYLLGALAGFTPAERVAQEDMPLLERWVLHRLASLDADLKQAFAIYDFNRAFCLVHDFCATDLSAFYFDVRKDTLYCDPASAPKRRAVRTVMEQLLLCLTAWLAPVLCFTAEEAWQSWKATGQDGEDSVHLRTFPVLPAAWRDDALGTRMDTARTVRARATTALEVKRAAKEIGSSLEARLTLHVTADEHAALDGLDMAEFCIVSACALTVSDLASVVVDPADGTKCARCWKVLPDVGQHTAHPTVCGRCADALHPAEETGSKVLVGS